MRSTPGSNFETRSFASESGPVAYSAPSSVSDICTPIPCRSALIWRRDARSPRARGIVVERSIAAPPSLSTSIVQGAPVLVPSMRIAEKDSCSSVQVTIASIRSFTSNRAHQEPRLRLVRDDDGVAGRHRGARRLN
jgi:hypothetical protein